MTSDNSNPTDRNSKRPKRAGSSELKLLIITGIAGCLALSSWVAQKMFLDALIDQRSNVVQNYNFIQNETAQTLQFMNEYQREKRTKTPDPEVLYNNSDNYGEKTGNILEAACSINPNSEILANHLLQFNVLRNRQKLAIQEHRIDRLVESSDSLMAYIKLIGREALDEMNNRVIMLNASVDFWKVIFIFLFLGSSLVSALTWLIAVLSLWKKAGA